MEWLSRREAVRLLELIDASRSCADMERLKRLFHSLNDLLSFDMAVCGTARFDGAGTMNAQQIINISYPEEWLSLYAEHDFAAVDPVVRAHIADFSAKPWSEAYLKWGRPQPFLSLAEDFGIRRGYSFGVLSSNDRTASIFSLCVSEKYPVHTPQILDILAPYFHEALRRTVQTDLPSACLATLTPREIEVISWLANGKNYWEISVILGISERTVKFHTSTIVQKLGAANRSHAVAIAISTGLISLA